MFLVGDHKEEREEDSRVLTLQDCGDRCSSCCFFATGEVRVVSGEMMEGGKGVVRRENANLVLWTTRIGRLRRVRSLAITPFSSIPAFASLIVRRALSHLNLH